jgi:hypothetical protein
MGTIEQTGQFRRPVSILKRKVSVPGAAAMVAGALLLGFIAGRMFTPSPAQVATTGQHAESPAAMPARPAAASITQSPLEEVTESHRMENVKPAEAFVPTVPPGTAAAPKKTASARAPSAPTDPYEYVRNHPQVSELEVERPDSVGDVWFTGKVQNPSDRPLTVKVLARAYTTNGAFVSSQEVYAQPFPIPAWSSGSFRSYVSAKGQEIHHVNAEAIPQ